MPKEDRSYRFNLSFEGNFIYFIGVIGAAIFFISGTATLWDGVIGFLKALVWPAFLVFEAFQFFQ